MENRIVFVASYKESGEFFRFFCCRRSPEGSILPVDSETQTLVKEKFKHSYIPPGYFGGIEPDLSHYFRMPMGLCKRTDYQVGDEIVIPSLNRYSDFGISFVPAVIKHVRGLNCCIIETTIGIFDKRMVYLFNWEELHTRCRDAIIRWLLIAKRKRRYVDRGVALMVAKMVWESRDDRDWERHRHKRSQRSAAKKIKIYSE